MEEPDLTQKKRYLNILREVIKHYRALRISVPNEDFIEALEFSAARLEAEIKKEESPLPGFDPTSASATFQLPLPGSPPRYKISEELVWARSPLARDPCVRCPDRVGIKESCAPQPLARDPRSPESPEDPLHLEKKKIQ